MIIDSGNISYYVRRGTCVLLSDRGKANEEKTDVHQIEMIKMMCDQC